MSSTRQPVVLLAAEIGVGIRYFCQTGLLRELARRGVRAVVVVPNPEEVRELLQKDFPGVSVEKLRLERHGLGSGRGLSAWLRSLIYVGGQHLRVTGMSKRMNLAVIRDYRGIVERRWRAAGSRQRFLIPVLAAIAAAMRNFRMARALVERVLAAGPLDTTHADLFTRYSPSLVVASSPGWWPGEENILREAKSLGITTLAVVPGWDHPSSKGLPGQRTDRVVVWSQVHQNELVLGSDFDATSVDICGPAHFDSYRDPALRLPREKYMRDRGLDPAKRLITFGCTFVGMSPNLMVVQALADAMSAGELGENVQLLVRLHPSHLKPGVGKYREVRNEGEKFYELAERFPNVRIESPLLGREGIPNYTNPADAAGLASLFEHTDVFVTLFSTMVLEAAFNDVPTIAAAFEPTSSDLEDFLPITKALDWPTHSRIIGSGAVTVVRDPAELVAAVKRYLADPRLHSAERRAFAEQECTFLDGRSSERLADVIASHV